MSRVANLIKISVTASLLFVSPVQAQDEGSGAKAQDGTTQDSAPSDGTQLNGTPDGEAQGAPDTASKPAPLAEADTAPKAVINRLFAELANPEQQDWERIEQDIWREWSKSGSPAMDLLLQRGRAAIDAGDIPTAIEHLTALIDHDPDFAEGWNARATAYFQANDYGPSLSDIRETLRREPRHFGALFGFGMILESLDEPVKALEVYRSIEPIHPRMPAVKDAIKRLEQQTAGTSL